MSSRMPPLIQDSGLPFDVLLQALTEQLDKAQAAMTIKARVGKLPLTFAIKEISLDLRAFISVVDDDIYVRPAAPGDSDASTLKLGFTTITKPMIEENATDFIARDNGPSLKDALGDSISEVEQRQLERIGVRTVNQLQDLRKNAGADVIARLSRMPVNRLQQALLKASAPRVTRVERNHTVDSTVSNSGTQSGNRIHVRAPMVNPGRLPRVRAAGLDVPILSVGDEEFVLAPYATQMGMLAEIDLGDGNPMSMHLADGAVAKGALQ
jgi:hypothetical protein